jgi:hypothetical protein
MQPGNNRHQRESRLPPRCCPNQERNAARVDALAIFGVLMLLAMIGVLILV